MTYQTNVSEPLLLPNLIQTAQPVAVASGALFATAITRAGALPEAGAYVAGVVTQDVDGAGVANVATEGYAVMRVAASSAIALDAPVAVNASGQAVTAAAGDYVLGHAMDVAADTGTNERPFYVRVALGGYQLSA